MRKTICSQKYAYLTKKYIKSPVNNTNLFLNKPLLDRLGDLTTRQRKQAYKGNFRNKRHRLPVFSITLFSSSLSYSFRALSYHCSFHSHQQLALNSLASLTFRMLTNNFVLQRMRALCPPVRHVNCEKFACYETSKLTKWNIFHLFSEKNVAKLVVMVRLLITYTLCACCGPAKAIATAAASTINIVGIACIYVLALLRFHLFC